MLHDRDELADQGFAGRFDQPVEAELGEFLGARAHRHDGEIQSLVGQEEPVGVEAERGDLEQVSVDAVLVVEFDVAGGGRPWVVEHVMVGQHQVRRDHRPGAVADEPSAVVLDQDAPDGACGGDTGVQIPGSDDVVGVDDGFEKLVGRGGLGHRNGGPLDGLRQQLFRRGGRRRLGQFVAGVVAGDPVQPLRDAFGRVRPSQAARRRERLLVLQPRLGAFGDAPQGGLPLLLLQNAAAQLCVPAGIEVVTVEVFRCRGDYGHAGKSADRWWASRG